MTMRCHYDVLGLPKECGDEEIKKSYRKLALQWHPDKNPDRVDECTKEFHLIQQAYEVLIDPQERAWYDKHRDAILRGGLGHGDKYEDNSLDVYQFFNASCYSGYGDDEKGFYAIYSEVFKKIVLEDEEYTDGANSAPSFGTSQSSYEEVVGPFYAYWESYCTAKSYVWVEKYDTREAPNRQYRRAMEQENKKLRDKARRERNEEVRALVAFVRKRDKRVQVYKKKLEERAIEIARLATEKKKRDRQQRLRNLENYKESSWSSMNELEDKLKELEVHVAEQFGEVDSDEYSTDGPDSGNDAVADAATEDLIDQDDCYDSLYCIACKKAFKSEKAMDNHNRSKRHLENVTKLQLEMIADDEDGIEEVDGENCTDLKNADEDLPEDEVSEEVQSEIANQSRSKKSKKKRRQQQKLPDFNHADDDDENCKDEPCEDSSAVSPEETKVERSKKDKKKRRQQQKLLNHNPDGVDDDDEDDNINVEVAEDDKNQPDPVDSCNCETRDSESEVKADSVVVTEDACVAASDETTVESNDTHVKKTKAGKKNAPDSQSQTFRNKQSSDVQQSLSCHKCRQQFATRNKLFEHIKVSGHALRVDLTDGEVQTAANVSKKGKDKKGQRKQERTAKTT